MMLGPVPNIRADAHDDTIEPLTYTKPHDQAARFLNEVNEIHDRRTD